MVGVDLKEEWENHKASKTPEKNWIKEEWEKHKASKPKKPLSKEEKRKWAEAFDEARELAGISKEEYYGKQKKKKVGVEIFSVKGQVQAFHEDNNFFYDRSGLFQMWNDKKFKYELSDEIDLLNELSREGLDTISSKSKTEIVNALRQIGRKHLPKPAPITWVQFKNKIYDYRTNELFKATPEYHNTNPIPWELGESEDTPTIDKLFVEWVGEEHKQELYEVIAYSCSSDQFLQRMIPLIGGGANGKGTLAKLLKKFIGEENVCTSELKELVSNQFETSALYNKLVCIMGEISHDDLKNTNQIKKLTGEDDIRFCFKGKTAFSGKSITTLLPLTNSMPSTPDKTIGFYRRIHIIDFPNQFPIKQGLIESIPEIEFNNLAKKVLRILNELYEKQAFTNEGSFQERIDRYEERSNPLIKFVETFCEEKIGTNIEFRFLVNKFNEYAKKNHLRIMSSRQISKILREEGFEMGKRAVFVDGNNKTSKQFILNLCYLQDKNTENTENTEGQGYITHGKSMLGVGISGISGISQRKNNVEELKIEVQKIK